MPDIIGFIRHQGSSSEVGSLQMSSCACVPRSRPRCQLTDNLHVKEARAVVWVGGLWRGESGACLRVLKLFYSIAVPLAVAVCSVLSISSSLPPKSGRK